MTTLSSKPKTSAATRKPVGARQSTLGTTISGETDFTHVIRAFDGVREVECGKMFGSTALKVKGKVFAMLVNGNMVAKLPRSRAADLVAFGQGQHFDPGHGRVMKEWVSMSGAKEHWVGLAQEAFKFLGGERA